MGFADAVLGGGPRSVELLDRLSETTPWRKLAAVIYELPEYSNPGPGRPPWDPTLMIKCLMLAKWFNLSDPGLEEALKDRISFRRFVGLSFTNATIIEAPRGRKRADGSSTHDTDASFTKKHGRTHHGNKAHIAVDLSKVITDDLAMHEKHAAMREQVYQYLLDNVEIDLPPRMTAGQAQRQLDMARIDLLYKGMSVEDVEARLADMRAQLAKDGKLQQVAMQIREHKAADRIIDQAQIAEVTAEEWNKMVNELPKGGKGTATGGKTKTSSKKTSPKSSS